MKWPAAVVATAMVIASSKSARAQKRTDVVTLSNWGRQRLQVDTAVKRELWKDFLLSLNVYDTFDSDPPQPDSARNDLGVSFSIGWSC